MMYLQVISLQRAAKFAKGYPRAGTNGSHADNNDDGNRGTDKRIFNRSRPVLIVQELQEFLHRHLR
jgi:hypothetical protein